MAMRSKTNIQTSWNSSEKIPIGACSGRKKQTKQSGSLILNHPNPILHTVPLFISILQRFDLRYHRNKWNHLNVQRSENWFPAQMIRPLIQTFNIYSINIQHQEAAAAAVIFLFATFSCGAPWQGLLNLLCNHCDQHGRNFTCSTRVAPC